MNYQGNVADSFGFTAQSTQRGYVERGQFTFPYFYWAGLVLGPVN